MQLQLLRISEAFAAERPSVDAWDIQCRNDGFPHQRLSIIIDRTVSLERTREKPLNIRWNRPVCSCPLRPVIGFWFLTPFRRGMDDNGDGGGERLAQSAKSSSWTSLRSTQGRTFDSHRVWKLPTRHIKHSSPDTNLEGGTKDGEGAREATTLAPAAMIIRHLSITRDAKEHCCITDGTAACRPDCSQWVSAAAGLSAGSDPNWNGRTCGCGCVCVFRCTDVCPLH